MYKIRKALLHSLLLASMVLIPSVGFGVVTDNNGGVPSTSVPQTQQKMNVPSTQKPSDQTSTGITTGAITFGIYYGRPYSYAPFYRFYNRPFIQPYRFYPYRPYFQPYNFYPYRPYYQPYHFYPYRPYYFYHW